jgi:hypothetical protein
MRFGVAGQEWRQRAQEEHSRRCGGRGLTSSGDQDSLPSPTADRVKAGVMLRLETLDERRVGVHHDNVEDCGLTAPLRGLDDNRGRRLVFVYGT